MKVVFFGTPDFAVPALEKIAASHSVLAVVTQPDKPVGRKQVLTPSAVKSCAKKLNIKVLEYKKLRVEGVEDLKALDADIFITCAYGQILSQEILDIPKLGTINIHGSILPKYRGSAPIQYAVINGDKETGITIMKTDAGIDTGDVILINKLSIGENETAGELFDRLAILGADSVIEALNKIENGTVSFTKQDNEKATYVKMIKKEDAKINWEEPAITIHNLVRGMNPWPVAFTTYDDEVIKIYKTTVSNNSGKCGEILKADPKNGLEIGTKNGSIIIEELQLSGGKRLNSKVFLLGNKLKVGEYFK